MVIPFVSFAVSLKMAAINVWSAYVKQKRELCPLLPAAGCFSIWEMICSLIIK